MSVTTMCRAVSVELEERLAGTAPRAPRWVLLEHGGPWGRDALTDAALPTPVVAALSGALAEVGARFQLVRRHRTVERGLGRTLMFANSAGDDRWVRKTSFEDVAEVADLVREAWPDRPGSGSVPGELVDTPVVLVCTHARRDACCAKYGRPLARWFADEGSVDAWETTHTGGHRFAPNIVVLPHGYVYGRVGVGRAPELLATHLAGRLDLDHLRGCSGSGPWEQVAELEVRRRTGLLADRDVLAVSTSVSGDAAKVQLHAQGVTYAVEVIRRAMDVPRPVSCGAEATDPGCYEVTGIEILDAAPLGQPSRASVDGWRGRS